MRRGQRVNKQGPVIHLLETNVAPLRDEVVVTNCGERNVFVAPIEVDFLLDRRLCPLCLIVHRNLARAKNLKSLTFAFLEQKAKEENPDADMLSLWEGEGGLCTQ